MVFVNDTATTEIYTLSLHDALPILHGTEEELRRRAGFKLTDGRGTLRDSLYEVDYCLICHERDKDSCSKGLHEKDGTFKRKDRKSTRLNSSHANISYAVFCLKKKNI